MSSKSSITIALLTIACLVGCQDKQQSSVLWGKADTYDDFLWKKHTPDTLKQTLCFDFNQDAKDYMHKPLRLGVFKKEENNKFVQVPETEMELFADGKKVNGNALTVPASCEELEVGVVFNDKAENKVHYWYIKPIDNGGLSRINDKPTDTAIENVIMEIRAKKTHVMNPLAEGLLFFAIFLVSALLVWFLILKPIFFPVFKVKKVDLIGPEPYINTIQIKRYRKLILTSKNKKQSWVSQLFTGQIKYSVNSLWTADVEFVPKDKRSIRIRPDKSEYLTDARILKMNTEYTLENTNTHSKTIIKLS